MALECVLLVELEPAVAFTVADGAGIPKGSLLLLADPSTVAVTTGDTDEIIGVAAEEKVSGDGKTQLGVYLRGIFKGFAGAAGTTAGLAVISDTATGAANELVVADVNSEAVVGIAFDTVADTQSFRFLLQPVNYNLA
jgi:hypothetical protein